MKTRTRLLAASLLITALASAPTASADKRIQLIDKDGQHVHQLLIRDGYDGYDVPNLSHVLLEGVHHEFFLVTFDKPCSWMDLKNDFHFKPNVSGTVFDSDLIDARSNAGAYCLVTKIQQMPTKQAGLELAKKEAAG